MSRELSIVAIGWALMIALALSLTVAVTPRAQELPPGAWRGFDGSWSVTGERQTVPTETGRAAAVAHVSGALVMSNGAGLAAGFTGEAIGFDDGTSLTTGRAVWIDGAGDRIFSALRGGPMLTGRHITGTITGGTGRWNGVTGEYEFTWQYVVSGDGASIQGRSVDLRGRLRWREGGR
ncbi:MAG TPA: hypothetical protein VKE51_34850 [Vicinamibacterales bacterium]|nr:hypothetical protein [Vicinamibacterales bacterium]